MLTRLPMARRLRLTFRLASEGQRDKHDGSPTTPGPVPFFVQFPDQRLYSSIFRASSLSVRTSGYHT